MKIHISGTYIMLLVIGIGCSMGVAEGAEHNLMPPGVQKYTQGKAVTEQGTSAYDDPKSGDLTAIDYVAIYTKDNTNKVAAFYRNALGIVPEDKSFGTSFYLGQDVNKFGAYKIPVTLEILQSSKRKKGEISASDLFGGLEENLKYQQMLGSGKHDNNDFKRVKQKYSYLLKAWYPKFDVKEKIYSCKNEKGKRIESIEQSRSYSDEDEEAMTAKIQQLIAQGRYDEAANIGRSMHAEGGRVGMASQNESMKDYWDHWIACYEDIGRHAYQTKVMIWKVSNRFRPATGADRNHATRSSMDKQGRGEKESPSEESSDSNELMDKGLNKLKGMFGF